MAHLRTEWLDTFIAAVETGSFTAAAHRVHRSQSAVSLQIAQLEGMLGRRLLIRGAGGLRPTADGERLLPYVRRAAEAVEAVSHVLDAARPRLLRVGLPDEYADGILPDVIARFSRAHPDVMLEVECAPSPLLEARISDGALDMAVALREEIQSAGEPLAEDPTRWVVSRRYEARLVGAPLPVALFDNDCSWRRWAIDGLEREGIEYRVAYTSSSVSALRAAIRSGIAVGLLGASTVSEDLCPYTPLETTVTMPASSLVLLQRHSGHDEALTTLARLVGEAIRPG